MSAKNGNKIFLYFGLALILIAIFTFFLFNEAQEFLLLNGALGKLLRCGIVAAIGLLFTFFGLIKK